MSLKSNNKIEENRVELEVSVEKEAFAKAIDASYKKNVKNMNIPGFRKGKAPKMIIEKMYGEGVFFEDAIDATYPIAYEEAVIESGIDPVSAPEVEILDVSKDGYTFKAKIYTKPEITVKNYKGLEATKTVEEVTDADIEADINGKAERNSRLVDVTDRGIENGDTAVFDFAGSVDGVPFEGGTAEKFSLIIGSGQFIPGFEDQMIGHKIGEEFDVDVTFPEEYHAEELKGAAAVFAIKLHEIKAKEMPAIDDEFAKDISEFDTLDELKADIKAKILEAREAKATEEVENSLINQVVEGIEGNIPQVMFDNSVDNMVKDFEYRLQSQGLNLETYLQYAGMDNDAFKASFKEQAEKQVKTRLALEKIAELENITATEEELDKEYAKIAEAYGLELDKVKPFIPAEDLSKDITVNKAIDLIKESAKIS